MPVFKIALDDHAYRELARDAGREERSIPGQASVLIRRALGVPAPTVELGPSPATSPREATTTAA
jgi:hypothetical protein